MIESDASNVGWGARQDELQTDRRWSLTETSYHINYLKLLAAFLALQCFAKHNRGDYCTNEAGQCHSSDIHQQVGGNSLPGTVQASTDDLGLVHRDVFLVAEHLEGRTT